MPAKQETGVRPLGQEDPLEKEIATHSRILVREIPLTEETGGLQSIRLQRVSHNSVTKQQQQQQPCVHVHSELPNYPYPSGQL